MRKERLPEHTSRKRACLNWRRAAQSSSTRSAIPSQNSRPNSCEYSKITNSSAWEERFPSPWTSALSPPRIRTWKPPFMRGVSAKTSSSGSTWSPSLCRPCANAKRSEEHTSELQSLAYLVCRLLLEKKKKYIKYVLLLTGLEIY